MDHLAATLEIKMVDLGQRLISGYAAVHHNVDRVRDVIDPGASAKAVSRLAGPSDVGVFIGHNSAMLPVGIPQKIEATPQGLYTETYILKGAEGDNLLDVARDLQAHGQSLGMSIGYRTRDSRKERQGSKTVRRLLDYELKEYSFAAPQAIANPLALVSAIKTALGQPVDDPEDDDPDPDDTTADDATPKAADTTADEVKNTGSQAHVNTLHDSAFLWIEPGGVKDDEGLTTPRSLRHLPYRDAEGKIDLPHLRAAISRLGQEETLPGLSDDHKSRLLARARRLLAQAQGGKTTDDDDAEEWKSGAPLAIWGLGARLQDLAERLADEHKALRTLGRDTAEGWRLQEAGRSELRLIDAQLRRLVEQAEDIERGDDSATRRYAALEQRLRLTAV
jgi:HK97 family phage prohead protease